MTGKLTICEYANVRTSGAYDAYGAGMRQLTVSQFPAKFQFSILVEITLDYSECGKYPLAVRILDADGNPKAADLKAEVCSKSPTSSPFYFSFRFGGIIEKPETLCLSLRVNREERHSIDFQIIKAQSNPSAK